MLAVADTYKTWAYGKPCPALGIAAKSPQCGGFAGGRTCSVKPDPTGECPDEKNKIHYSYDVHGNVKTFVEDIPELDIVDAQYSTLNYKYDLLSGNVLQVDYQHGLADQYFHRYHYDADNRITHAWTSRDSTIWDLDAKYFYYAHGPLARVEIGDLKVQGLDYAYTIQGWLKGVNQNSLQEADDMGLDGAISPTYEYLPGGVDDIHLRFGRDAMGFTLGYYNDGTYSDYTGINSNRAVFMTDIVNGTVATDNPLDLYNGNIKQMDVALAQATGGYPATLDKHSYHYSYDQLNRITGMDAYATTTNWTGASLLTGSYKTDYTYDANGNILTLDRKGNAVDIDGLTYTYTSGTNMLDHVDDTEGIIADDIGDQSAGNYDYDEIGNLTYDYTEEIETIDWTVYGKIAAITRATSSTREDLRFRYGATGNRYVKENFTHGSDDVLSRTGTYYRRDASGNVMAVYKLDFRGAEGSYTADFELLEHPLYGSSRIGNKIYEDTLAGEAAFTATIVSGEFTDITHTAYFDYTVQLGPTSRTLGEKRYELANHLGNVLATVSDRKIMNGTGSTLDYFEADVKSVSDYYPFGMVMPGRKYDDDTYRYGFNGMEKDDEVKSSGNSLDFGMRIHDPRLGRFLSVDPQTKELPSYSPYSFSINNPIMFIDEDGEWPGVTYMYFKIEGGAGFFADGISYIRQSGVARDEVGKTHFTMVHAAPFSGSDSRNDQIIYGGGGSLSGGIEQSWKAETFIGDQVGWQNTTVSADLAAGPGVSIGVGHKRASVELGVGLEVKGQARTSYIEESISLTYNEADNVNKGSSGNQSWGLANRTTRKDDNERYWAEVTIDVGKDKRNMGVKVFSTDGKIWQSENYSKEAYKAEQEGKND